MVNPPRAQALADVLKRFLAQPGEPGAPYWALVGVTAAGEPTGDLWGDPPSSVTVFETRELAEQVLKLAGHPSPEPPVRMKRWEVRGMSRDGSRWLEGEAALQPNLAMAAKDGRVVARPLSGSRRS